MMITFPTTKLTGSNPILEHTLFLFKFSTQADANADHIFASSNVFASEFI